METKKQISEKKQVRRQYDADFKQDHLVHAGKIEGIADRPDPAGAVAGRPGRAVGGVTGPLALSEQAQAFIQGFRQRGIGRCVRVADIGD